MNSLSTPSAVLNFRILSFHILSFFVTVSEIPAAYASARNPRKDKISSGFQIFFEHVTDFVTTLVYSTVVTQPEFFHSRIITSEPLTHTQRPTKLQQIHTIKLRNLRQI